MNSIIERLNKIPEKLTSETFLDGQGLGNEIGFWIFDYAPSDELKVREHISFIESYISRKFSHLKLKNINLLQCLVDYLESRNFVDKAVQLQQKKGDDALIKALRGPLHMDKFAPFLQEHYQADEQDIVLITGVGSVWPLIRAHDLLNSFHALLGHKPIVLFYPGEYTGQAMSLFGKIPSNNYYRAFRLVP